MTAPLSPTPKTVVLNFLKERPDFTGHIAVISYTPNGRGGRRGLTNKESWFSAEKGRVVNHERGYVNVLIDIRHFQINRESDIIIRFGVGMTPAQKRDEAMAKWAQRNLAPRLLSMSKEEQAVQS